MTAGADAEKAVQVRRFHQILFWPLQLMPLVQGQETHWGALDGDPLWELLDSLANEKLGWGAKASAFLDVWRKNNQFTDL